MALLIILLERKNEMIKNLSMICQNRELLKLTEDNPKTGVRLSSEQISLPKLQIHVADFRSTLSPTNVKL